MTYRITALSNPKSLILVAVVVLLPAAAVLSFFVLPILLAVILAVAGGYISYHLGKYIVNIFRSRIETNDEGIRYRMTSKESSHLSWEEISHAGYCKQKRNKPCAFVYCEEQDRLLTIPNEYSEFYGLIEELRTHLHVEDIQLEETETITGYLRESIGIPDESENE